MKNYLNQLLIIAALIIVGCSDPCRDVDCGLGACDDGTCICPVGYEGTACETLEIEKYFGTYNETESMCIPSGTLETFELIVAATPNGRPQEVTINLGTQGIAYITFTGTLKNGKVEAALEGNSTLATILGDFTDVNTFVGVYNIVAAGGADACSFTMKK